MSWVCPRINPIISTAISVNAMKTKLMAQDNLISANPLPQAAQAILHSLDIKS